MTTYGLGEVCALLEMVVEADFRSREIRPCIRSNYDRGVSFPRVVSDELFRRAYEREKAEALEVIERDWRESNTDSEPLV